MGLESAFTHAQGSNERTLADRAFAQIHDAIVAGRLAPGERLPIEDVAAALDMSPMPIREALRRLDGVGLLENVPHRGARVAELSIEDLSELYEARLALEPLAIKHAAERRTEEEATEAQRAFDALKKKGNTSADRWAVHREFHFSLYRAAHSAWLIRLITPLWESSERYRLATIVKRTLDLRQNEHEAMLQAVVQQEADRAGVILHDHLAKTANEIASDMGHESLFEMLAPARQTSAA